MPFLAASPSSGGLRREKDMNGTSRLGVLGALATGATFTNFTKVVQQKRCQSRYYAFPQTPASLSLIVLIDLLCASALIS